MPSQLSSPDVKAHHPHKPSLQGDMRPLTVGIVGGGIAGLYAALLLQRQGHVVRVFEGTDRVGGRVCTHFFSQEEDQYFEAGAMRIPDSQFHSITFDLIGYINSYNLGPDKTIKLINYVLEAEGNDAFINGHRRPGAFSGEITPAQLNWPDIPPEFNRSAKDLMMNAIKPFLDALNDDFDQAFTDMVQNYDNYSFRFFLQSVMDYSPSLVDFLETVLSQTNQFALSVPELVMQNLDFNTEKWVTIDRGMSRLPNAMASIVGSQNITYGARVTGPLEETFDRIILAIPPAALKMIVDRPLWPVDKEMAIRSMHFEPLYKMGLRFKTRFWERTEPNRPSHGGQSTTDLPIRWVVFPSNGIGADGPGVLLIYAWMSDASAWLPLSELERRDLALRCIAKLYEGQRLDGKPIDVFDLVIGTADSTWSSMAATGDAMFLPGQFTTRFEPARRPEGSIYFAGEHLSRHHTWISGAAESALCTVRQILAANSLERTTSSEEKLVDEILGQVLRKHAWPFTKVDQEQLGASSASSANDGFPAAGFTFSPI
ncbi:hypothetical protein DFH09DRAFT_1422343 [Mycena vulgaris]|nr:hypothetical protein DFH09DRAFT_1422343 [Mycena vulgaris]